MPHRFPAVPLLAAALAGCASIRTTSPKEIPLGTDFEVRALDPVHVSDTPVVLTVMSIADSRCPSDVTCVSAGDAVVALKLGDAQADTLHTMATLRHTTSYAGHQIELVDVRPYPRRSAAPVLVQTAVIRVLPQR